METVAGDRAILDAFDDALCVLDSSGALRSMNRAAENLTGYVEEELRGRPFFSQLGAPDADGDAAAPPALARARRRLRLRRKDGTTLDFRCEIDPLSNGAGDGGSLLKLLPIDGRDADSPGDLTLLKRAEDRLLMLSAALEQSPVGVMIANKDGEIEYVNSRFASLTGYAAHELIGRNPRILQSNQTESGQYRRLWESIRSGAEWRGQIQDRRKDGELYWASEIITPLRDARDKITHFLAVQQDITEQKRDKEALLESEQRFRQVADMAGDWLWEQDAEGRYTYSSGAVEDVLGMTPQEVLGKTYVDLFAGETSNPTAKRAKEPTASRRAFHRIVNHYRHKNGGDVFTESTGAPILDERGRLVKWRGVDHNITSRKKFEDALRVRNRAIEAVPIGIAIWDAQAQGVPNVYVNPALCRITGFTREELLGHSMHLLQGPGTDPAALDAIRDAIARRHSAQVTVKFYRKDGVAFWDELFISPVADEAGRITHFVSVHADISERRRTEESRHELEIAKHIQLSLLPHAPLRTPHMEIAGICVPAMQVGGDYYDYFENCGAIDIVIADVSGHSVGAALLMTEVRSTLRAETRKTANALSGPAELLRDLNELLHEDLFGAELFITMFYVRFLPQTRMLQYANAGHNPPLLLRAEGSMCAQLDADGLVLGVMRAVDFKEESVELAPGDRLLFYTDGITEAQNRDGDFFGLERLCNAFRTHRALAPGELIHAVLDEVRAFRGEAPAADDVAMVVAHVR